MSSRRRIPSALAILTLIAACGMPATAPTGAAVSQEISSVATVESTHAATTTTSPVESKKVGDIEVGTSRVGVRPEFDCPVTIPPVPGFDATKPKTVTYSEDLPSPDPWPRQYPHEGMVWYGSEGLWTPLAIDGHHTPRKSVWWSVNFPGGIVEKQPDVSVTWTRLDTNEPVVIDNGGEATNAFTPDEGWFMIAGIDPDEAGCWEVEAAYKGATLSYVYENTE